MNRFVLSEKTFYRFSDLVKKHMGIKMPIAKKALLESRLQKLIRAEGLGSFEEYYDLIAGGRHSDSEIIHFCNAVATNKTEFFREKAHFDYLAERVLPELYKTGCRKIRVWSAASSTGEEPYTLAMVLAEFCEKNRDADFSVLGTDISTKVLSKAKPGIYTRDEIEGVSLRLQQKYFRAVSPDEVEVVSSVRNRMRWGRFNLMTKNYNVPGPFEVIFCRNVLIYFNKESQSYIYDKLVEQIVPGGYLFLGHSESMAGMSSRKDSVAPAVFRIS